MYDKLIDIVKDYIYKMGVDSFETFSMSYNCSKVLLSEKDLDLIISIGKRLILRRMILWWKDF